MVKEAVQIYMAPSPVERYEGAQEFILEYQLPDMYNIDETQVFRKLAHFQVLWIYCNIKLKC